MNPVVPAAAASTSASTFLPLTLTKKKSIEKQPKAYSKSSKLKPMIVQQRTSFKIGQKIKPDGVIETPKQPQSHQQVYPYSASISTPQQSWVKYPQHYVAVNPSIFPPRNLYDSTDILQNMSVQPTQIMQQQQQLYAHHQQQQKQLNLQQQSLIYQKQQQQYGYKSAAAAMNNEVVCNENNQLEFIKRSNVKNNTSIIEDYSQISSYNRKHQQPLTQHPLYQQTTMQSPQCNGLNFTFQEDSADLLDTTNKQPISAQDKHEGMAVEDDILPSDSFNHLIQDPSQIENIADYFPPFVEEQQQQQQITSKRTFSSHSSSNNQLGGKSLQSMTSGAVPAAPSLSNQMMSKPITSLPIQSTLRYSLADSIVVKKSGRYSDEYENAQCSSGSQKDGKKLIMLGRGGFGQVFLIKQKNGAQEERAMKIVPKGFQEAFREVMILKKFSHPNVLKIYEYFEDENNVYVITERCYGYNLFDYILLKGQFSENETCKIADGVLRALSEAHKQGIVHRDVKPDNIMLDFNETRDSFTVKLIDWGLADQLQASSGKYLSKRCGTLHFLAPEVLTKHYNEKADLWSLGMALFTLIQGSPPICGKSQAHILEQIQGFQCEFKYSCWKSVSDEAKDLIRKLLERDPVKRISAVDALRHPWFQRLAGTVVVDTQDLRSSFTNLVKYSHANMFKKTVLGFFASHLISKRERNKFMDIFEVLDKDKDGELSVSELKAGFSKLFNEEEFSICHSEIESIFFLSLSAKFEGATGIKYEEFLSSMLACSATYSQDSLKQAFQLFDKENKGTINLDQILSTLEIPANSEEAAAFKQAVYSTDENHSGQLDFDEFKNIMTNFLDQNSQVILSQEIYLS